ncbi:hypothetical protein ACROYT_G005785 [Oculina patagonica]
MILGKAFLVWATLFVMGLAFSDGSEVPNDPVFDCLKTFTLQALQCYKTANHIKNSHRGGALGSELRKLVPNNYRTWPNKTTRQRAQQCMTALKNFVEPLKVVVQSEKRTKNFCRLTGHTLNKTLHGLLRVLENSIKDIDEYVRLQHIKLKPLRVKPVNMTSMTALAAHQMSGLTSRKAVQLRNFVLLDFLDQVVYDIKTTAGSCFNTKASISFVCPV